MLQCKNLIEFLVIDERKVAHLTIKKEIIIVPFLISAIFIHFHRVNQIFSAWSDKC